MNLNSPVKLYEEFLRLQNLKKGEKVVIVSEQEYARVNSKIISDNQQALANLNVDYYTMILPPKIKGINFEEKPGTDFIFDSLKDADFIYTMGAMIIYGTDRGYELLKSGIRSLNNTIDESTLRRLWPTDAIINRTFSGAELMEEATTIRFKSGSGTDLEIDKTGRQAHSQCSLAHIPGRWDNAGYGRIDTGPPYALAEGTVVFDRGDFIQGMSRLVTTPIKCIIKDGYITSIEGDLDAKLFRMWLDQWNDPECYRLSHVGWGTNDGGIWAGKNSTFADKYNYFGSITIAFGSNTLKTGAKYSGFDTKIEAASHCDNVFLNHSMWLDGEQIIKEGNHVHPKTK
jgi:2,5-dihydroxypyridine 5,6-dioxygenase